MAGAFSGHIIDSYYSANQARSTGPFGQQSVTANPILSTHGAMSFNSQMHGTFPGQQPQASFSIDPQPSYMELSDATILKIAALQAKLNQKLGPEYISQRPGPGGPKLTYAEGWKMINLANEVFGFNGWSSTVVSLTTDFIDFNEETRRYTVGVTAIMRVVLRDGVFHEDIGYGMLENSKSKGAALDKCKKEAVTDGLKRSLRNFGNLLGNCLYDKAYTQEVIKIKVPPPKFDKSELHRRPEFDESKPNIASTSTAGSTTSSNTSNRPPIANTIPNIKVEPKHLPQPLPQQSSSKPISSLPSHMRSEIPPSVSTGTVTPDAKGKGKASATPTGTRSGLGLNTPLTTPAQPQPHPQSRPPQAQAHASYRRPPPPPQPAPERKVSFAEPTSAHNATGTDADQDPDCGEESFNFYSDDDAFLAAVDLGEGDLGRPILSEEDLGRPIDYEEGVNLSAVSDGGSDARTEPQEQTSASVNQGGSKGQHHQQQNQGQGRYTNAGASSTSSSGATGMLSRLLPNQPPQFQQRGSHNSNPRPNHSSIPNQTTRPPANRPNENYNPHPNHANANPSAGSNVNIAKRPVTPSAGVFNFPPGVNPPLQGSRPGGPLQRQSGSGPQAAAPLSGIGMKRGADVMQGSSSRRPAQGMGLAQQHGGQGARREPLGRLDVGEGGDVKRMKR